MKVMGNQLYIDLTGSASKLAYKPLPSDDPTQRCPDISVARDKLAWEPVVKLDEGLKKTVEYFDKLRSGATGATAGAPCAGPNGKRWPS